MEGIELGRIIAGRDHSPVVYFLLIGNRVKIGTSTSLVQRVKSLSMSVDDVALVVPGGHDVEAAFHKRWHRYRVHGEWFHVRGSLAGFLGEAKSRRPTLLDRLPRRRSQPPVPLPPLVPLAPVVETAKHPVPDDLSLREAVDAGLVNMSLAAVRSARARDPEFPKMAARAGQTELYAAADLQRWVACRQVVRRPLNGASR